MVPVKVGFPRPPHNLNTIMEWGKPYHDVFSLCSQLRAGGINAHIEDGPNTVHLDGDGLARIWYIPPKVIQCWCGIKSHQYKKSYVNKYGQTCYKTMGCVLHVPFNWSSGQDLERLRAPFRVE